MATIIILLSIELKKLPREKIYFTSFRGKNGDPD
jgi:hypothetical protein